MGCFFYYNLYNIKTKIKKMKTMLSLRYLKNVMSKFLCSLDAALRHNCQLFINLCYLTVTCYPRLVSLVQQNNVTKHYFIKRFRDVWQGSRPCIQELPGSNPGRNSGFSYHVYINNTFP